MAPHSRAPQSNAENFRPEQDQIPRGDEQSRVLWVVIALFFVVILLQLSNEVSKRLRPSPPETTGQSTKSEALAVSSESARSDFAERWVFDGVIR